jgi:hypothetical protein
MKDVVQHDTDYMSAMEYSIFVVLAIGLTVPVLIGFAPPGFLLLPATVMLLATIARVRDAREIQRKEMMPEKIFWSMCTRTSGCVLEDGHGGECKMAKGF